jgi:glucose-6-phosphate 1-dehydrogenase
MSPRIQWMRKSFVHLILFFSYHFAGQLLALEQHASSNQTPSVIVIFGATGDLTARKVLPAIYHLAQDGHLSENTVIVGIGRREYTNLTFRAEIRAKMDPFSKTKITDVLWNTFEKKLFYCRVNFESDESYRELHRFLLDIDEEFGTQGNRIYYLAIPPSSFSNVIEKLQTHQLIYDPGLSDEKGSKVIIEKPFGSDLNSALELQAQISECLDESQVYRMDHYLGKVGVQNLYALRFENALFEPLWNHQYIDHIQMTHSEEIGIGSRARFWEETGLLRDVFQNHLIQILSILAMEPPQDFNPREIHREKIKLLNAIRAFPLEELDRYVIRGQYGPGQVRGFMLPGYRQEEDIPHESTVETFVAAKLFIDNDRWNGVPIYIRSGKRMPVQTTEIVVAFKEIANGQEVPEALFIRIQPSAGIFLRIASKVLGVDHLSFGTSLPVDYEKLILDCIRGDHSSFVDAQEQFAAWRLFTPVIDHWKISSPKTFPNYEAGTWGPEEADALIGDDGRKWQRIEK